MPLENLDFVTLHCPVHPLDRLPPWPLGRGQTAELRAPGLQGGARVSGRGGVRISGTDTRRVWRQVVHRSAGQDSASSAEVRPSA